jgi:hypothetical protein
MNKDIIITALRDWIHQRPRLEFGNYGDVTAYRAEARHITQQLKDAQHLLSAVSWRSISAEDLIDASRNAFGGRLTIDAAPDAVTIDYTVGQYWPTEYRAAACAVLSQALWEHWRRSGSSPTATARRELARPIAKRWFN